MIFDPDNFEGRPYVGGLNQLGHVIAGAALVAVFGLPVSVFLIVVWEFWQLYARGADKLDFKIDLIYWLLGALTWGLGWVMWPLIPIGAFIMEYLRIRYV